MTSVKQELVEALSVLLLELRTCGQELTELLIQGLMAENGGDRDKAIRELAKFEVATQELLDASKRIGEA